MPSTRKTGLYANIHAKQERIAHGSGEEKDVFVHYSSIAMDGYRSLTEGQRVEFEVVQGDKRGRELGFPTANVPTTAMTAAPATSMPAASTSGTRMK